MGEIGVPALAELSAKCEIPTKFHKCVKLHAEFCCFTGFRTICGISKKMTLLAVYGWFLSISTKFWHIGLKYHKIGTKLVKKQKKSNKKIIVFWYETNEE